MEDIFHWDEEKGTPGKKEEQKLKALLVMQYILKNSDEDTPVTMEDIKLHLANYGITAERRSIYRDIAAFQKLIEIEQNGEHDIAERDMLNYEITFTRKPHPKAPNGGYYVTARPYEFAELRLLAECVNSARFLSENQAKNLRRTISGLCSAEQAKTLNTDSTVVNRMKTANKAVMASIATINGAIQRKHQVSFKYLSYSFSNDMKTQVERRAGKVYTINPYKLLIDNGFFYVLAYDGSKNKTTPYRIDRMKDVRELDTRREWEKEFALNVNMDNFTQRVFSMFTVRRELVTIRFLDMKLDTVIDQFGTKGVKYEKVDESHFTVETYVEVSDMFYSWVCGFGRRAKILNPPHVVGGYEGFCCKGA